MSGEHAQSSVFLRFARARSNKAVTIFALLVVGRVTPCPGRDLASSRQQGASMHTPHGQKRRSRPLHTAMLSNTSTSFSIHPPRHDQLRRTA